MIVLTGCSGSPDPVEAYLADLDDVLAAGATDVRELLPADAAATRTDVVEVTARRRKTLGQLQDLDAPPDVEAEHRLLVENYRGFVEAAEQFLDATTGLDPGAFEDALFASVTVADAQGFFQRSCLAMSRRADALEHHIALDCSG